MRKSTDSGRGHTSGILDTLRPAGDPEGLGLDVLTGWVSASSDGVLVLDSDLRIVYATPAFCELVGRPLDRMLGRDVLMMIPERCHQTVLTHFADVRNGKSESMLGSTLRPDGSELEFEVKGSVLEFQGRRFFVMAFQDVTERQQQARQAVALAQAAASVAGSDSIEAILDAISECALVGTRALAAWVKLADEDDVPGGAGAAGVPDDFRELLRSPASAIAAEAASACLVEEEKAVARRRVVVYADWRQQMERALGGTCPLDLPWQPAAIARLLHGGVAVGLLIAIFREGEMPYAGETTFLAALADQAATAAANARLLAAAREKVTLEERQRLARELHDSVSQSLYAIRLGAQTARERLDGQSPQVARPIDHIMRLAEASQAEMRALIFELRPESLEMEGLVAALNRQIDAVRARHGIAAPTITSVEPELPIEVKQALHQIAREALWNTVKHARARRVDVRLEPDGHSVVLEIADDGVGFDPGGSFPGHLGLRSMHERASGVGGSLEIVSGRGTRVIVRVPTAPQGPSPSAPT